MTSNCDEHVRECYVDDLGCTGGACLLWGTFQGTYWFAKAIVSGEV